MSLDRDSRAIPAESPADSSSGWAATACHHCHGDAVSLNAGRMAVLDAACGSGRQAS